MISPTSPIRTGTDAEKGEEDLGFTPSEYHDNGAESARVALVTPPTAAIRDAIIEEKKDSFKRTGEEIADEFITRYTKI